MTAPAISDVRKDRPPASAQARASQESSLHSQPQLPSPQTQTAAQSHGRPWVRWLITLIVLAGLGVGGFFLFANRTGTEPAGGNARRGGGPVPIVAAKAVSGDLPVYLTGLGTVTPLNTVVVRSRVEGELIDVKFKEDQEVNANDLLAQIDPEPFKASIAQASGQLAKDTALMNNAHADVERYTKAGESVSKQQLETAQANEKQYAGAVEADKGALRNAQLQLEYSTIRAPISGRIGLRFVDKGNMVRTSDANGIAVINQIKPITIVFTLPQDDIPKLRRRMNEVNSFNTHNEGTKQAVVVDAFDRELRKKITTGEVLAVDNQVDPNSGTIRIKAVFKNEHDELYPNQYVNARLLVDVRKNATLIPTAAVQRGPDNSSFVYVVKNDTIEIRKVKLAETEADRIVVEEGLRPGEIVATDGVDKLQAGSKVRVTFGKWKGSTRPSGEMSEEESGGTSRPAGPRPSTRGGKERVSADFGFWICDFGLKSEPFSANPKSQIQNPKSIRDRAAGGIA
jgi:multidrug efflux system membrane fusion protein